MDQICFDQTKSDEHILLSEVAKRVLQAIDDEEESVVFLGTDSDHKSEYKDAAQELLERYIEFLVDLGAQCHVTNTIKHLQDV